MLVKEVMTTNPTCCIPSDTAQTAAIIMRDEDTGIVPIVEQKGSRKLVGVVTDRDLCISVLAEGPVTSGAEGLGATSVPVERCMTSKVICCSPDDDLDKVFDLMKENQVRRIIVVDPKNVIEGIVSFSDLMNRGKARASETRETIKGISEPTGEASKPRAESANAQ
jgi:CBS domain-containing protein